MKVASPWKFIIIMRASIPSAIRKIHKTVPLEGKCLAYIVATKLRVNRITGKMALKLVQVGMTKHRMDWKMD